MTGLSQADINRLAHEAQLRAPFIYDTNNVDVGCIERHPDVIEISGRLAMVEALQDGPRQLFGYDDTDEFRRAILGVDTE